MNYEQEIADLIGAEISIGQYDETIVTLRSGCITSSVAILPEGSWRLPWNHPHREHIYGQFQRLVGLHALECFKFSTKEHQP